MLKRKCVWCVYDECIDPTEYKTSNCDDKGNTKTLKYKCIYKVYLIKIPIKFLTIVSTQLIIKCLNCCNDYDDKGNNKHSNVCTNHNVPSRYYFLIHFWQLHKISAMIVVTKATLSIQTYVEIEMFNRCTNFWYVSGNSVDPT
jgi:hypothetical protein